MVTHRIVAENSSREHEYRNVDFQHTPMMCGRHITQKMTVRKLGEIAERNILEGEMQGDSMRVC